MITIKSYKAGKGDAFLVSFGENKDYNIMIDMGISSTYKEIKPDLELLASNGKKINLLVITHMHDDHIAGAIKFIKDNGLDRKIIEVDEVWHNSYRHLNFDEKNKSDIVEDRTIRVLKKYIKRQEANIVSDDILEKISVGQGSIFSKMLYDFNYNWNGSFDNKAVILDSNKPKQIGNNIKITLISPNNFKLNKLSDDWLSWLDDKKIKATADKKEFEYAFEFLMRQDDTTESYTKKVSVNEEFDFEILYLEGEAINDSTAQNGTSIAFILEYKDKKLLFLGDAHEDIIYKNLNELKINGISLDFDLVKLSHHGSINNISNRLLSLIQSKRFLISTNGKGHGHPSIITLAKVIMSKNNRRKEIIFNYSSDSLDSDLNIIDKLKPLMKNYNYEVKSLEEIVIC